MMLHNHFAYNAGNPMSIVKSVFRPIGWLFSRTWWLLDGVRRAILNLLLLAIIVAVVFAIIHRGPKPLQPKTALVLDLNGQLVEQFAGTAREQALAELRGSTLPRQTRLRDVLSALDAAAKDDKISMLVLDLDDLGGAGLAGLHEVAAGIQRFKTSGKPVLAYGDAYSQRAYFLAAQASEIYMHPMGGVNLTGFGGYRTYFKDALDRLGISANVLRVGMYKNAAEPYFTNGPSKATLEADGALYGELWTGFTTAIETARKLPQGRIASDIEQLPQQLAAVKGDTAQLALQQKLVDGIKTRDEMRELLIARGAKADDGKNNYRKVSLGQYQAYMKPEGVAIPPADYVSVVVAEGAINDGEAGPGSIGGDSTARLIRQAREDEHAKAIVLRVNSPGGSPFASEIIRRELELARKAGKPVVISMGDVAASGGYWISMAADQVIADPATITGSIGVFGMLPTADKLLEKLSLHTGGTTTTWLAQAYDPRRPLDPRMAEVAQQGINHIYDEFTTRAAAARKKTVGEIDAIAQGRVWTGAQALERGLIDRTGSLDDAFKAAGELAKLEGATPRVVYLEREPSRSERLLASLGDVLAPAMVDALSQRLGVTALPKVPAALQQAGQDLTWLSELAAPRTDGRPFAAAVHCLCTVP